ncbi:hypothetical protein F5X99DRAFT_395375 [Biscogniauxia marginata]|nr:hypothetical protein F5X99DRAFT_395375 [Biscogniauxia marginata]
MDLLDQDVSPTRGTKRKYSGGQAMLMDSYFRLDALSGLNTDHTRRRIGGHKDEYHQHPVTPHMAKDQRETPNAIERYRNDGYYKRLYRTELDFRLLGQQDQEFGAVLERDSHLNFNNPVAVMQLTKTLLKLDFGLKIELPMDRLCPPVPNRHNYILWLKDLLDSSASSYLDQYDPTRQVTGLDIGTGASLIYPLLGCAQRPWSFIATDVDPRSLSYARKNAELNNYQSRIRVVDRIVTDLLIPLDELGVDTIDFVMVNPPFYVSDSELQGLARQKSRPPNGACTGAPIEMVCEGGEVGFVKRIIDESMTLRGRVQWYTSMLGKQSSLDTLVDILKDNCITNYAVMAFIQGNRTRRWAIGWSFGNLRPAMSASRGFEPSIGKGILPHPTEATVALVSLSNIDPGQLSKAICNSVATFDLVSWNWDEQRLRGIGFAGGNVWSRAYRRRKAQEQINASVMTGETGKNQSYDQRVSSIKRSKHFASYAFGFAIVITPEQDANGAHRQATVVLRWLQGNDYALFESFAGVLRNTICIGDLAKDPHPSSRPR